jgi:hypothetical protein
MKAEGVFSPRPALGGLGPNLLPDANLNEAPRGLHESRCPKRARNAAHHPDAARSGTRHLVGGNVLSTRLLVRCASRRYVESVGREVKGETVGGRGADYRKPTSYGPFWKSEEVVALRCRRRNSATYQRVSGGSNFSGRANKIVGFVHSFRLRLSPILMPSLWTGPFN